MSDFSVFAVHKKGLMWKAAFASFRGSKFTVSYDTEASFLGLTSFKGGFDFLKNMISKRLMDTGG